MRVAVLGLGLIGGSVGIAARERAGAHVVGWDPDPGVGPVAREHGAVDEAAPTLVGALAGADVAFAAAPVDVLGAVVADALRATGPDCVVSDVGSVKAPVVDAAYGDPRFVGGHPVAGAEAAGVAHARGDLFQGAVWYLTPTARTDGMLYQRLYKLVGAFGARPAAIDAAVHDRRMSVVSHLPVIVDPSHAAGRRALVEPLSLAAAAVGADGIIVEVHPEPDEAICDGPQQLRNDVFADYAARVEQAAAVAGKVLQAAV
jgi:prephenate dehydrogenase